jgi:kinesin family protein 6/9
MPPKETVQVVVRTRPTSNYATKQLAIDTNNNSISVHIDQSIKTVNNKQEDWNFNLSRVLHNASQDQVYETVARDIVDSVLEGYNGTILAYGQTGAGKTFTMTGGTGNYNHRGIIPRAIGHIFQSILARPQTETTVKVSYLEIYNEQFYDLFRHSNARGGAVELAVRDQPGHGGQVDVKGLNKLEASSEEQALTHLFEGEQSRAVAEHAMNINSTRSHCVFTIYLESRSKIESSEKVVYSKLNLVDLAGSERVGKTGSTGQTLKEAKYINQSLSYLEQVVLALASRSRDHVPYRQSKLTNVLRDSLGGNCKTRMVANIWAEPEQLDETISTLKFSTRMMKLANDATVNIKLDPQLLLKKYEREIKELKQELAMHDTLANRTNIQYESFTPEQQTEMRGVVNKYIRDEIQEIEVVSVRQIRALFGQFKNIVIEMEQQLANGGGRVGGYNNGARDNSVSAGSDGNAPTEGQDGEYVGSIDQSAGGFHVGQAADNARPVGSEAMDIGSPTKGDTQVFEPVAKEAPVRRHAVAPDETVAFEEYKVNEGSELQATYTEHKTEMDAKKKQFRTISGVVNKIKKDIDKLRSACKQKEKARINEAQRSNNQDDVDVIDEEEFALIKQLKDTKKVYKERMEERKALSEELVYLKGQSERAKMALCNKFLEWYKETYPETDKTQDEDDEVLDDGEQFDKLELDRVMADNPDSVPYYNARKTMKQKHHK